MSHLTPSCHEGMKIRTDQNSSPIGENQISRIVMEDCPDQRIGEKGGVYRY